MPSTPSASRRSRDPLRARAPDQHHEHDHERDRQREQHADDRVVPEHDRDEAGRHDRGQRDLRHRLRVVLGERVDAVHGGGRELAAPRVLHPPRARGQHVLGDEPAQRGERLRGGTAPEPLRGRGRRRPHEDRRAEHDERARGGAVTERRAGDDRGERRGLHDERDRPEHPGGDRAAEQPPRARREREQPLVDRAHHPRRSATRAIRSIGLGRGAPTAARVTRSRNSQ